MLVLTGMEFIFFIVTSMRLYFGFVLETVLIIQGCFCCCWAVLTESRPLLLLTPPHQRVGWGAQEVGRGHSWDSWPQLTKGVFHTRWCHAQQCKSWGKRRKVGMFGVMPFVFPSNCYMCWSPAFLEHLPADGKWWMNSLFCFVCTYDFCFTYYYLLCLYLNPRVFSLLLIWFSLPSHCEGSEWALGGTLVASWG